MELKKEFLLLKGVQFNRSGKTYVDTDHHTIRECASPIRSIKGVYRAVILKLGCI